MKISPADTAFSKCVREANNYTCEMCGKTGRMECSHVYSRRHRTIRWCKDNAKSLCNGCHRKWHESPVYSFKWFEDKYGSGRVELLIEKMNNRNRVKKLEEKDIAKHYREQLKLIEAKRAKGETGYITFESWQ